MVEHAVEQVVFKHIPPHEKFRRIARLTMIREGDFGMFNASKGDAAEAVAASANDP